MIFTWDYKLSKVKFILYEQLKSFSPETGTEAIDYSQNVLRLDCKTDEKNRQSLANNNYYITDNHFE